MTANSSLGRNNLHVMYLKFTGRIMVRHLLCQGKKKDKSTQNDASHTPLFPHYRIVHHLTLPLKDIITLFSLVLFYGPFLSEAFSKGGINISADSFELPSALALSLLMLLQLKLLARTFTVNKRETRKDHVKVDNSPQQIQPRITDVIIHL